MSGGLDWLDKKLGLPTILDNGTEVAQRESLNIVGATITDNPSENRIDIELPGSAAGGGVADLTALRAVSSGDRIHRQRRVVQDSGDGKPAAFVWLNDEGAGVSDDSLNVIKPSDVLIGSNGRWYREPQVVTQTTYGVMRTSDKKKLDAHHIDVRAQYGAEGDGSTDDLAALNAAVAAASDGDTLFLPAGTYIVSGTWTISKNITLRGVSGKTIIKAEDNTNYETVLSATSRSGLRFQDIIVDANKSGRASALTQVTVAIFLTSCTDTTLDNVTVQNTRGYSSSSGVGLAISGAVRLKMVNCKALNCGGGTFDTASDGTYISGTDVTVTNYSADTCGDHGLVFERCSKATANGVVCQNCSGGIAVSTYSAGDTVDVAVSNFSISGAINLGLSVGVVGLSGNTSNLRNVAFSNGVIDMSNASGSHPGITFFPETPAASVKAVTNATNASPIVISCTAHGFANGDLVNIFGVQGNRAANGQFKVANKTTDTFELHDLSDNPVAGSGAYVAGGSYAQPFGRTVGVTFANVRILNAPTQGYNLSNCDDVVITGGAISATGACVQGQKYVTNALLRGIRMEARGGFGCFFDDGSSELDISDCRIIGTDGVTSWGIYFQGSDVHHLSASMNLISGSSISDATGVGWVSQVSISGRDIKGGARVMYWGADDRPALSIRATNGSSTKTGLVFDVTGNYGFLDYDLVTGNGSRWSSIGPLLIGQNTNAAYGSSVFTQIARFDSSGQFLTGDLQFAGVTGPKVTSSNSLTLDGTTGVKVQYALSTVIDVNNGYIGINGTASSAATTKIYAAGGTAAIVLKATGSGVTGLVFDNTAGYGFLDYDLTSGNGVRLSALSKLRFGLNSNDLYGAPPTFTDYMQISSTGVRLLTVGDISSDLASTWKTTAGALTVSGFAGLNLQNNGSTKASVDSQGFKVNATTASQVVTTDANNALSSAATIGLTNLPAPTAGGETFLSLDGSTWLRVGPTFGASITDSNATYNVSSGHVFVLAAATLSANRTATLGTTGATDGAVIQIYRLDTTANTLAVVNGGTSGGTMYTFAASTKARADFRYDAGAGDWVFAGFAAINSA